MADPGSSQGPWYPPVIRIGDDDNALPPQPAQWNPVRAVSSARVDTSDLGDRSKLRKVERACDHCRKRKAKCDGPQRKNHICSTCEALSKTCTYLEDSKPRGPPRAYISALEERLAKAEALVRRLRPELDMTAELGPSPLRADLASRGASHGSALRVSFNPSGSLDNRTPQGNDKPIPIPPILPPLEGANPKLPPPVPAVPPTSPLQKKAPQKGAKGKGKRTRDDETAGSPNRSHRSSTSYESSDSQYQVEVTYPKGARLTYRGLESSNHAISNDNQLRFQGMSSSVNLLHDALEIIERDLAAMNLSKSDGQPGASTGTSRTFIKSEPAKLYDLSSWEKRLGRAYEITGVPDELLSVFPPDDLAEELIRLYFLHEHTTYPVLHRPTFEREWREQLHKRSVWYACLCMAMFGLASRFTSDPRVLPDTAPDVDPRREDTKPLPGWKYMSTNIMVGGTITEDRSGLMLLPELHEMQAIVLMAYYMRGMVGQDTAWYWTGALVMKAQDMGLHREHTYDPVPTLEQELWRRVCWHAISLNRFASMHLGKSCFAREEDVDLLLPLEVDDEYWELDNPEKNLCQPAGKPALVSGFVQWIKLSDIVVRTLNSLFTARKPDAASLSTAESWEESVVEQLNEMLLKFTDDLPPHLRWKADMEDTPFAYQAALLYEMYHVVHALVQRPFLALRQRRRRPPSAASDKALGICVTAARASLAIADAQLQRGTGDVVSALHVLYIGVGTLLMQFWEHVRLWAERRLGDEAEDDARRMDALLTEIDGPVRLLQEFAPKWEVARAMLDHIQCTFPVNFSALSVRDGSVSSDSMSAPSSHRHTPVSGVSAHAHAHPPPFVPDPAYSAMATSGTLSSFSGYAWHARFDFTTPRFPPPAFSSASAHAHARYGSQPYPHHPHHPPGVGAQWPNTGAPQAVQRQTSQPTFRHGYSASPHGSPPPPYGHPPVGRHTPDFAALPSAGGMMHRRGHDKDARLRSSNQQIVPASDAPAQGVPARHTPSRMDRAPPDGIFRIERSGFHPL